MLVIFIFKIILKKYGYDYNCIITFTLPVQASCQNQIDFSLSDIPIFHSIS